jgi:hypothetical protein
MFLAGNLFLCVCVRGCLWAMMISWIIIQFFFSRCNLFFFGRLIYKCLGASVLCHMLRRISMFFSKSETLEYFRVWDLFFVIGFVFVIIDLCHIS